MLHLSPDTGYAINSGTWECQHDLTIRNTYGTINKIANKNVPNSTIKDVWVHSDNVWPSAAYQITVNSGIEPACRDILPGNGVSSPDRAPRQPGQAAPRPPSRSRSRQATTSCTTHTGTWNNWNDAQDFRGSESHTAQAATPPSTRSRAPTSSTSA